MGTFITPGGEKRRRHAAHFMVRPTLPVPWTLPAPARNSAELIDRVVEASSDTAGTLTRHHDSTLLHCELPLAAVYLEGDRAKWRHTAFAFAGDATPARNVSAPWNLP